MEYENTFVKEVKEKNITNPLEILNWYRNLYYKEGNHTEHGIMAYAINDVFMAYKDYVPRAEIANEIIDYIAELTEITEYLKRFDQYYQIGYCQAMNVILGGLGELKRKYSTK